MPHWLPLRSARPELAPWVAITILLTCAPSACVPPDPDAADRSRALALDLDDPALRRIADLQDRMAVDSLLRYFGASEPEQRYLAARAFGSLRYDSAVAPLTTLLSDPILEVRTVAAYALGQQGDARAVAPLTAAFERYDTAGFYAPFHAALLEAIGKTGDTSSLRALATVSTYGPRDTLLQLGRFRGIYRMAVRGITSEAATAAAVAVATDPAYPHGPRLYAAHYAARAELDLVAHDSALLGALTPGLIAVAGDTAAVELAVALSLALGKTDSDAVASALPALLGRARDVRTRVALLRTTGRLAAGRPALRAALRRTALDSAEFVARTAAAQLLAYGTPEEARDYWRFGRDSAAAVAPTLYAAALRHLPPTFSQSRGYIIAQIERELRTSGTGPAGAYRRADLLRAMGEYPFNYRFLIGRAFDEMASRAERTAAAEALDLIAHREDIVGYLRGSLRTFKREYADYFRRVFASDDASLQAVAAGTIMAPALNFDTEFAMGVPQVLAQAQQRLKLPQHTETFYALDAARAHFDADYTAAQAPPVYNHEVNWDIYRSLQPGLEVAIETPRGEIVVDLFEDSAPATVVNFLQLVRTGFYNGKGFHRVVPGFVTQGGDPQGDGYGGLDFTIRTETPPLYYDGAGYLGMAAAGPHTEGVQFFFTHAAAPHLDGRYTIFGRVTKGMDAVLALRRGDEMRMRLQ